MNRAALWRVSVSAPAEAEEAMTELLGAWFEQPVISYTNLRSGKTILSLYLEKKPDWSQERRREFGQKRRRLKDAGINPGSGRISLARIQPRDWAESWKRHFRPIEVGRQLLIKPSWSRRRPRAGQAVVVLDPGLSFGTGQHPTTAFCLDQLVKHRRPQEPQSLLDVGTGSGILAIAAARLGYRPIAAFDHDPEAVRVAHANLRQNGVRKVVRLWRQDVRKLTPRAGRQFSLVCANVATDLLVAERERLTSRVAPGGLLVLAGILSSEFARVRQTYEIAGLRLVASRAGGEWRSGSFAWRRR